MGIKTNEKLHNKTMRTKTLSFIFEIFVKSIIVFCIEIFSRFVSYMYVSDKKTLRFDLLQDAVCEVSDETQNRQIKYFYPRLASSCILLLSSDNAHEIIFHKITDRYYEKLQKFNLIKKVEHGNNRIKRTTCPTSRTSNKSSSNTNTVK